MLVAGEKFPLACFCFSLEGCGRPLPCVGTFEIFGFRLNRTDDPRETAVLSGWFACSIWLSEVAEFAMFSSNSTFSNSSESTLDKSTLSSVEVLSELHPSLNAD